MTTEAELRLAEAVELLREWPNVWVVNTPELVRRTEAFLARYDQPAEVKKRCTCKAKASDPDDIWRDPNCPIHQPEPAAKPRRMRTPVMQLEHDKNGEVFGLGHGHLCAGLLCQPVEEGGEG